MDDEKFVIDMTWEDCLPYIIAGIENGHERGREISISVLIQMARAADIVVKPFEGEEG